MSKTQVIQNNMLSQNKCSHKTVGHSRQMVTEDRWSQKIDDLRRHVVMEDRCSQQTGGHGRQVVIEDTW